MINTFASASVLPNETSNTMMQKEIWHKQEFIQQYFERLREAFSDDEKNSPTIVETVELDHNYAIILLTDKALNENDVEHLITYIIDRLKIYGYQLNSSSADDYTLQASVRNRVSGIQLFGTIKIVKKKNELRLLVTPYNDRQYERPLNRFKLMEVLFA